MICRFCGGEVTSTKPGIDYCMFCHYQGLPIGERYTDLTAEIEAIKGVAGAGVYHTGGGIFVYEVRLIEGDWLWASGSLDDTMPDTAEGPWGLYRYVYEEDEGDLLGDPLDRAGLVAAVKSQVDGR